MPTIAELAVDDWHRLNRLLEQALDLEPQARGAWLEAQSELDEPMRSVLRSLLQQAEQETGHVPTGSQWDPAGALGRPGDRVGPYRLERELARGGMGVVWIAARADGAFERQVALKLPRAEWAAPGLGERMARERAILAGLVHPHIAQLYDAGWTEEGRPYLALEYVEGTSLDAYCAAHCLDIRARVRLFVDVARAVAFAHTRLVVHRDLKPSNVMVTSGGTVKLLDFGIAKLLAGDGTRGDETALTRVGGRALTIPYAAPEQILGQPVSAATDVYSLGVMLYELLTGRKPHQPQRPASGAALEDAILNVEPVAPSRVAEDSRAVLRGDLDTIVLKALKKRPEQRYDSAAELADDLERFLAQQPIRARPDSRSYRTRMFIRRHRLPLGAASGLAATLLLGAGIALWQAHSAREQARQASAIKDFVLSMIRQADPRASAASREADVALLAAAEQRIAKEMTAQPAVVAELRLAIADAYANRGLLDRARAILKLAIEDGQRSLAPDDPLLALARIKGAQNFVYASDDSIAQLDLAISAARSLGPRGRRILIEGLRNRAIYLSWSSTAEEYERDARELYELARAFLPPGDPLMVEVACVIGWPSNFWVEDRRTLIETAYNAGRANLGEGHPAVLQAQVLFAIYLAQAGRTEEALRLTRAAIETARSVHGTARPTEDVLGSAQPVFWNAHDINALERAAREAFRMASDRFPNGEPIVGVRAMHLINALYVTRRVEGLDEAWAIYARDIPKFPRGRNPDPVHGKRDYDRGLVLLLQGDAAGATELFERATGWFERRGQESNAASRVEWGWALRESGQAQRSLEILAAEDVDKLRWGEDRQRLLAQLAASYLAVGNVDLALQNAQRAVAADAGGKPFSPDGADAYIVQGRALLALGRAEEAVKSLATAAAFWREFDPDTSWAAEAAYWHGRALAAAGEARRGDGMSRAALTRLAQSPMPSHRAIAAQQLR